MSTALARFEEPLAMVVPKMEALLPAGIDPNNINQTIFHALSQNDFLAKADVQSVQGCAITAAVLALQVDGYTGQGYMLPFKDNRKNCVRAQFLTGYKGYVTLADRAARVCRAGVVLDGDDFDFDEAAGWVKHKRQLGRESQRSVLASWCVVDGEGVPPVAVVLSHDQILERRDRSPSWRNRPNTGPWHNDFQAMCRKTAVHAASNFIPVIPVQLASALQTQHELGNHAQLNEQRNVVVNGDTIEGEVVTGPAGNSAREASRSSATVEAPAQQPDPRATVYLVHLKDKTTGETKSSDTGTLEKFLSFHAKCWLRAKDAGVEKEFASGNLQQVFDVAQRHPHEKLVSALLDKLQAASEE